MKTIGLLGGMSWESTVSYYRLLNEDVRKRLGGLHSARAFCTRRSSLMQVWLSLQVVVQPSYAGS